MEVKEIFAKRFAEAVDGSQISYAQLAKRLNISKPTVSMYKSGKAMPSLETFYKICEILDVSADFLLGKKEL